jgi:CDP-diacylglycerol--serine O-phosphatidyltransferase
MASRAPLTPLPPARRRRPRILSISVLPTLLTAGNALAGVVALSYLMDAWGQPAGSDRREHYWVMAAWMVGLGMLCDLLDGRVARLTGSASAFGAELDSLADVITFGVTPALLAKSLISEYFHVHPKWAVALVAVYAIGAALRLARYNVESARTEHPGHVTRVFRGLPTPGAAGVIAALVLLRNEFNLHWLDWGFLVGAPVLGLLMVSRFPYPHLVNQWLSGRQSPVALVLLVPTLYVAIQYPEATLAALCVGYALSGPFFFLTGLLLGRPRWATDEEADEEEDDEAAPPDALDGAEDRAVTGSP